MDSEPQFLSVPRHGWPRLLEFVNDCRECGPWPKVLVVIEDPAEPRIELRTRRCWIAIALSAAYKFHQADGSPAPVTEADVLDIIVVPHDEAAT